MALGLKAAYARKRTLFFTAEELISAEVSKQLPQYLDLLSRVDLIIINELGYLQITPQSASLFFRLITKRYEKGSVIVTNNRSFEE